MLRHVALILELGIFEKDGLAMHAKNRSFNKLTSLLRKDWSNIDRQREVYVSGLGKGGNRAREYTENIRGKNVLDR